MNIPTDERMTLDGNGRDSQSDCARAMAEAEKALRELALRSKGANKQGKAPPLIPAPTPIERVVLDPGLDFGFHKDGIIELTGVGFRRMAQAHSAAIDVAIAIDGREVLRFPAQRRDGIDALPEKEFSDLRRRLPGEQCYGHIGTRFAKI
jgi:hypothetical protein